jgi:hypothetical protein
MPRLAPVIVLVVLSFLVAELLPGSAPITQPLLWPFLLLIYGPGAVLIRESVRRSGRGWESILLLGAAYGLIEEGLALQSLFNPTLYGAALWGGRIFGINGVYAVTAITIHAVWSAAVPILLTDLLFPSYRDTPYLGRFGLLMTAVWYGVGVALLALLARFSIAPGFRAPAVPLAVTALIVLVLAVLALVVLPRNAVQPKLQLSAPQPRVVLIVVFASSLIWHIMLALLWRVLPAFARWPLVLAPVLGASALVVLMVWLLRRWASARGWNDRHRLALSSGALLSHSLIGSAILTNTPIERVGSAAMGLMTIVLLVLFAVRVRDRVQCLAGVATPTLSGHSS